MEHLESILDATDRLVTFEIPYISSDYDLGEFTEFGSRLGYQSIRELFQLHEQDPNSFVGLLQRWLYFGLLREVFGTYLVISDFIIIKESRELISTTQLPRYCQGWLQRSSHLPQSDLQRLWNNISFAARLSSRLDKYSESQKCHEAQLIVFSIKLLIDTLAVTVEPIVKAFVDPFAIVTKPETSTFLLAYLVEQRWCPCRLASISRELPTQALYPLTACKASDFIGSDHEDCTKQVCRLDNLPSYPAQHTQTCLCHNCPLVEVPVDKIAAIYRDGDVPVLSCTIDSYTGGISVGVLASHNCRSFTAISHVWSDGLGNDTANALHECQLTDVVQQVRRLQDMLDNGPSGSQASLVEGRLPFLDASNSHHPAYFWLDTLCIPLDKKARQIAIGRIDWTFAAAKAVLVRERSIRHLPLVDMPLLKLAVHMRCLKWLTRCWTLVEGIASWKIYLEFADRAYNLTELRAHLENFESQKPRVLMPTPVGYDDPIRLESNSTTLEIVRYEQYLQGFSEAVLSWGSEYKSVLSREIRHDLMACFNVLDLAKEGKPSFVTAWNTLLYRSTTKLQDVPGILAVANSISIRDIIQLDYSQRLKAIINTFSEIPASLLFNDGPKYDHEPKNKWVPSQIHGGRPLSDKPSVRTYQEGRMVGPLYTSAFRALVFPATALGEFDLATESCVCSSSSITSRAVAQEQLHLRVELSHARPNQTDQQWCLVLPADFMIDGYLATTASIAFCATIQKMHIEKEVEESFDGAMYQRYTKNALVTWDMTAKVTVAPRVSTNVTTINARELTAELLYVECDMQNWASPEALVSSLTREQTADLHDRILKLKITAVIIIFLSLSVGLGLLNSDSVTKASVGVKVGVSAVLIVFILAFFLWTISVRTSTRINYEPDTRTHEEWSALFLDPELRAAQSWQYRFERWLRRKTHRSHNDCAQQASGGGQGVQELESQLSERPQPAAALNTINKFFTVFSAVMSMEEKISLVRLMLCFTELGLLACIDHALAGYTLQQVAVALTFLPVIVSLFLIPIQWAYRNINVLQKRTIMTSIFRMVVWLIHMGVLLWVVRSPLLKRFRSVGLAAVVLAGLQPLLILWVLIDRQFVWFAEQWKKSPLTYYDIFEMSHHEEDDLAGNFFFAALRVLIWHPLCNSWKRSRSRKTP
ncbi:hypothetical protein UA08_02140 [Talaromyces atroroseus]|uniref:Heterokaryon incompatibility domain-containing protein n=1 Tax=Talaromyces atroroseus TaxID=1441469 RepID=A0A225B3I0_TALAT|nr:hypothetical protein UA08_02140 [Talaromyces atroroseus]OKL62569.1 hypothetical protein UA08_02140 [Talaromyces atroroseus]